MNKYVLILLVCAFVVGIVMPSAFANCGVCGDMEDITADQTADMSEEVVEEAAVAEESMGIAEEAMGTAEEAMETAETAVEEAADTATEVSGEVVADVTAKVQ